MEIDLESHLRALEQHHRDDPQTRVLRLWIGDEGRLIMSIEGVDFTVFGQNTAYRPPKPPPQTFAAKGIDSTSIVSSI